MDVQATNLQNICTLTLQTVQGMEANPGTFIFKLPTATMPPISLNPHQSPVITMTTTPTTMVN